ncbi:membrane protein [Mycolicibacterium confluentis]|uniref:Membrane protein n=1 Tax=Mycolicibacterium confluentis TaxID=28047 RepID=A0A7I7Y2C7_9MYCO|nr:membrane protein [Mycolicibacterium confluentis]
MALGLLALPLAPTASADPLLFGSPTLPLPELGSEPDLLFYGQNGTVMLNIPVPQGMTPESLNVTVQLPVNVRSASVTVSQDNRLLTSVELPPEGGPLAIPLNGVEVQDNSASVLVRSYLLPVEGYCLDPSNPLRLANSAITFVGAEASPTTVADFLPPVLRRLVIQVGESPSRAEADAVVRLATAVTAHYGAQHPQVVVESLAGPAPVPGEGAAPLERHIVVSEGPDAGLSLVGPEPLPALLISGPPSELTNQTRLLTSGVGRFALSSKAVAGPLKSVPQLARDETTIRDLGQPGVNAIALNPQVGVNLDQTRMGRSVKGVRVHLIGSYTPLPTTIGGQVVASVGGEIVARWPVAPSGTIDRWVEVPDRLLQRNTTLAVQVNISGDTGRCGEFQPVTLTIDGSTVVTSKAAHPPVVKGFQSLPQAMMPRLQVGLDMDRDPLADLIRAVKILTGLQRVSALPFGIEVTPIEEAVSSPHPAVLIDAEGWSHPQIQLAIKAPDTVPMTLDVLDDEGEPTTLTLDPKVRFGSLQTVVHDGRSILVATSNGGAVDELDNLLTWLDADARRWSALNGVGLVSVPGRAPVTVPGGLEPDTDATATSSSRLPWLAAGGLAAGAAVVGLVWLVRRRPSSE